MIEIITIENPEKKLRVAHFTCATCGKERYGIIMKKTAQTLLSMMRNGTTIYPYCDSCPAPEMPENDSLSISFAIYTVEEEMAYRIKKIQEEKKMLEKDIEEAIREKDRLLKSLKEYREQMKEHRKKVKDMDEMVRHTNYLISEMQKALMESIRNIEKSMKKVQKGYEKVVKKKREKISDNGL